MGGGGDRGVGGDGLVEDGVVEVRLRAVVRDVEGGVAGGGGTAPADHGVVARDAAVYDPVRPGPRAGRGEVARLHHAVRKQLEDLLRGRSEI